MAVKSDSAINPAAEQSASEPVIIERTFNAPIAQVWKAITNKDEMKKWYFDLAEFKPEVGFEFRFDVAHKGNNYRHLCKVTEMVPQKKSPIPGGIRESQGIRW